MAPSRALSRVPACLLAVFAAIGLAIVASVDLHGQNSPVLPALDACPPSIPSEITVTTTGATYRSVPTSATVSGFFTTDQNADVLVSGIDFDNTGGSQLFNHPGGIATDGTRLVLTDTFNNRVLIWNSAPASNTTPDVVVGQANFTTNAPGTGRNQMNWPMSVSIGGGKLFVTDTYNDRILIWNAVPTTSGSSADVMIELKVFGASAGLWPWGVWSDGTKLVVTATGGGFVHVWNSVPTTDNVAPSFTLSAPGTIGTPRHVTSNGTMLIVGDHNATIDGNPKVGSFFWTAFPTGAGSAYTYFREDPVDFHGPWMKGTFIGSALWAFGRSIYKWNSAPASSTTPPDISLTGYNYASGDYGGVAYAGGRLYVASGNANKILGFSTLPTTNATVPDFAIGSSNICTNTLDANFFIQNGVPRSNGRNLFVSSDFDHKLYVWRNLPDQSNPYPDLYYNLPFGPWGMALREDTLVLGGGRSVYIWETLPLTGGMPSRQIQNTIGSVTLGRVRGVALDSTYFYVSDDENDKVYVWRGLPQSTSNPEFAISVTDPQRIVSDGTYLAVTETFGHRILIYAVATLSASSVPMAIGGPGTFNLPSDAYVGNGRLFVADTGFSLIHTWSSIGDALAGKAADIILGESSTADHTPEIRRNKTFWPGAVWYDSRFLWVGEFKFSTRMLRFSPRCGYEILSSATASVGVAGGTGSVTITPNDSTCAWTATSNASFITVTSGASGTGTGTVGYSVAANSTGASRTGTITIGTQTFTVTQSGLPTLTATPSSLRFGAAKVGAEVALVSQTPAQEVTVVFDSGAPAWTATTTAAWLQMTGGSGSGRGRFTVAIINPGNVIGASTSLSATIDITSPTTSFEGVSLPVTLTVAPPAQTTAPFGAFDTPAEGATGVVGAIAVTGWSLDDQGVDRVELWRNCVETIDRAAGACAAAAPGGAADFVFIGRGVFLAGARPDVEASFATSPLAYRAGWGYLMLTNALPHLTALRREGGQGTFTLSAYAVDVENRYTRLGTKTITLDNDHATIPFGAIDTPEQGGTVPGSTAGYNNANAYPNFGWAMTQIGKCIDTASVSAYRVYIDGVVRTLTPATNWFPGLNRSDIAAAYPGYCNTTTALAAYYVNADALGLTNGLHTIGWDVIDNQGNVAGIGSRFFIVSR